jgi:hypothetical protein
MGPVGAAIVCWGGRCIASLFFFSSGWQLLKDLPAPPQGGEGGLAILFVFEAMILIVTSESITVLLRRMRVDEDNPDAVVSLAKKMFSIVQTGASSAQNTFRKSGQQSAGAEDKQRTEAESEDRQKPTKSDGAKRGARRER